MILVHRDFPSKVEVERRLTWLLGIKPRLTGLVVVGPGKSPNEISWRKMKTNENYKKFMNDPNLTAA